MREKTLNQNKPGLAKILMALLMMLIFFSINTAKADIGLDWLAAQTQADGSYTSELNKATPFQSTAEVIKTFSELNALQQLDYVTSLQYLQLEPYQGTEYLSRLIITQSEQGQIDTALVSQLQSYQNKDGGFGELPGHDSTVLDTTYAIQALAVSGQSSSQTAGIALNYLQTQQHQTGYFYLNHNEASVYLTAIASQALQTYQYIYQVSDNINQANGYLQTLIQSDGAVGELFETALALKALAPATADQTIYQPIINHLTSTQQTNGSWADDVYTTALAISSLTSQQTLPPQPGLAHLSGLVKDGATNTPIANVSVLATTADNQTVSALTNAEGRYQINNIAPGTVSIDFTTIGYFPATASAHLIAEQISSVDINLLADPSANPISLTGQIIDAETNLTLAEASVQILNSAFSAQSDPQGLFAIPSIAAGSFTIEVKQTGYQSQLISISAPAGGAVDLGIIRLTPGTVTGTDSTVSGLITDATTGEPLRGVLVSISGADNQSTFTSPDGQYLLTNVTPGNIVVTTALDEYQQANANAFLLAGTNLQFNALLVNSSNPGLVTIQGQVIDAETQQPLTDANVLTTLAQTTTDTAGEFLISGLEAGTINLEFSANGYNTVEHSINANSGGLINLATIALAKNQPVTGNNPPTIQSIGPVNAAVGQPYEYQPQVNDPENDQLIFGLTGNPSGMEINTVTGNIRWIPTTTQIGEQTYTHEVSDTDGAVARETVIIMVTEISEPSYVITDVETLNSLTVDTLLPNNYLLGSYLQEGREGTWRAESAQGCGFNYIGTETDPASITAAANALDFWAMGSGNGSEAIWDLGEQLSTVTVLPLLDQAPVPQEGIEYTLWGSNDPDAVFPDGWSLATLVTIYSQGWADNAATCGGGVNIDDYAGLYTFGSDKYQYIRLKADNSITIFDTPEHTTFDTAGDDSGLPGWQSLTSEIDGVAGMICEDTPEAHAGTDILGITRETIAFDGTASQGNIVSYGWDLDNDNEIDITGAEPEHIFNAGFDQDVTLYVVDDQGCVGTDKVHVTIGLDFPKPDYVVSNIDTSQVATNVQTLAMNGTVAVTVRNQGNASAIQVADVTLFEDLDNNSQFDPSIDSVLGTQTMPSGLARDDELLMSIAVNGTSVYRDSPILAMVDRNQLVDEGMENNNISSSINQCKITPTVGSFDPVLKWEWSGSSILPLHNRVLSLPIVAPLEDGNNDNVINELDAPSIIFISNSGDFASDGVLRAISGIDGHEIWTVSDPEYRVYPLGSIAVADIDSDGKIEIIAPKEGGGIIIFENTGEFKWQSSTAQHIEWGGASIADIDNDGSPEIIVGNSVLRNDGTLYWEWSGYLGSSNRHVGGLPIALDINLDGTLEVITGASAYSHTGQLLWENTAIGDGFTAIGNFDADDYPEIVVVSSRRVSLLNHDGTIIWGACLSSRRRIWRCTYNFRYEW